jgi:hypothetical protein
VADYDTGTDTMDRINDHASTDWDRPAFRSLSNLADALMTKDFSLNGSLAGKHGKICPANAHR